MTFFEMVQEQLAHALEHRSEPRTFENGEVLVKMLTIDRVGSANVLEWSVRGMRIRHHLPLRPLERVKVLTPDRLLDMRVVWVAEADGMNEAGLTLDAQFRQGTVNDSVLH